MKTFHHITVTAIMLLMIVNCSAQINLTSAKVAVNGYDPVSYFQGEPTEGKKSIAYKYEGAIYRFANADNKAAFVANPTDYLPQYGGWCAYAVGKRGKKVEINPETYKIIDNKLYLFYNSWGTNTLTLWNKDEVNLLPQAEKYWKKIGQE